MIRFESYIVLGYSQVVNVNFFLLPKREKMGIINMYEKGVNSTKLILCN